MRIALSVGLAITRSVIGTTRYALMTNWLKPHAVRHPQVFPDLPSGATKKGKNWNAYKHMPKRGSLASQTLVKTIQWTAMSLTIVDSSAQTPVIIKRTRFLAMAQKYSSVFLFNISQSPWNWNQEQQMQRSILLVVVKLDTEGTCLQRGVLKAWVGIGVGSVSYRSKVKWVAKKESHVSMRMSRRRLALSETTSLSLRTRG